jgi:hypothetical protein
MERPSDTSILKFYFVRAGSEHFKILLGKCIWRGNSSGDSAGVIITEIKGCNMLTFIIKSKVFLWNRLVLEMAKLLLPLVLGSTVGLKFWAQKSTRALTNMNLFNSNSPLSVLVSCICILNREQHFQQTEPWTSCSDALGSHLSSCQQTYLIWWLFCP